MDSAEQHALDKINRITAKPKLKRPCYLWLCLEPYCKHQETAPGHTRFCPECGCEMDRTAHH